MTAKEIFEYALVELNKREAPSLLLEDYNYFINKAVSEYVNRIYAEYELNQQRSDDVGVLKSPAVLIPAVLGTTSEYGDTSLFNKTYQVILPDDYRHILGCIVEYKLEKDFKCFKKDSYWQIGANRLTSNMFPTLISNHYFKPSYKKPFYYIANVNTSNVYPTSDNKTDVINSKYVIELTNANITTSSLVVITLSSGESITINCTEDMTTASLYSELIKTSELAVSGVTSVNGNTILIKSSAVSNISVDGPGLTLYKNPSVDRIAGNRYGNKTRVRMEIRYGSDDSTFKLNRVFIDYLKEPQFIKLTQDQIDEVEDTSQILEFPDYVCQEIIKELIKLLMENASDPRIQSHIPVNQSIPSALQNIQRRR